MDDLFLISLILLIAGCFAQDPCDTPVCKPDKICVPTPIRCITAPCPQFRCVDKPPVPTRCPSGLPELKGYNCGLVVDRQSCPSTHYCEVHPADAYAVCCPNKAPPKQPCPFIVCDQKCKYGRKRDPATGCFSKCDCNEVNKPPVPTRCPSGLPELKGYNCGMAVDRLNCPSTHYCEVHPADAYAVCCPNKAPPKQPCPFIVCDQKCKYGRKRDPATGCFSKCDCNEENDPTSACSPNPCARSEKCVPDPKACFAPPCPQHRCEPSKPQLPCPLLLCDNKCKYGRKRDPKTGCISECGCNEGQCSANEEYKECGSCETTCKTLGNPVLCTEECRQGCQCKAGYVRDQEWRCIPEGDCPNNQQNEPTNGCSINPCARDEKCVPVTLACFAPPCPQFRCEPTDLGCPMFKCLANCPNGFAIDPKTGCQDGCKCVDEPECPLFKCLANCPNGFAMDPKTGCQDGCKCVDEPECPLFKCSDNCPNGFAIDPKTGCQDGCKCVEIVCPEPTTPEPAPEFCGYSLLEDSNGCKSYQMWCA